MTVGAWSEPWGEADGEPVRLWHLRAPTALGPIALAVAEWGATLQSCLVPDEAGRPTDLVLGHDTLAEYQASDAYFGATLGRWGGRIRDGLLVIDGEPHRLPLNEGAHHLHGGPRRFDRRVWRGAAEGDALVLSRVSPDGEMGYPGRLEARVAFRIRPEGALLIAMRATAERSTVCNLVHHGYWNLGGESSGSVLDHVLGVHADEFLPPGPDLLPTGEVRSVEGTPLDFRAGKPVGRGFQDASPRPDARRETGVGFDHALLLRPAAPGELREAAWVRCPASGLGLRLATTAPALQLYAGGDLSPRILGKGGRPCVQAGGIALETQASPHLPPTVLRPGETYRHDLRVTFQTVALHP